MCPHCQAPVRSDAAFCTRCGTALRQPQPPASEQFTQPPPGGPAWPGQAGAPGWPGQLGGPGPPRGSATPPFALDLKRLGTPDLVVGGSTAVVVLAIFLPWFGIVGITASGIASHGYLVISLLAGLAVLAYLVLKAGWEKLPFTLPLGHVALLLAGTGVQFFFVLVAFLLKPAGLSWEFGAYLALIAALAAGGVVAVPAIRSARE